MRTNYAQRLEELSERGALLRQVAAPGMAIGLALGGVIVFFRYPDGQAGFSGKKLLAPADVAQQFGAHLGSVDPGLDGFVTCILASAILLCLAWQFLKWVCNPLLLRLVLHMFFWAPALVAPPKFLKGDEVSIADVSKVSPDAIIPTTAYAADQAHFVLAQRAYYFDQPQLAAKHLRLLSGEWRPQDALSQSALGALVEFSRNKGEDPGLIAPKLAQGRPHILLKTVLSNVALGLSALLIAVSMALELAGRRRLSTVDRLRRRFKPASV